MLVTNKVTMDLVRRNIVQVINAVQGDSNTRAVEITITAGGQPEPVPQPSQLDIIEAQVTYTAMMADTLLEV